MCPPEEEENNGSTPPKRANRVAPSDPKPNLKALLARAVPFLRDAGEEFEDDGSNEPLELARSIEAALQYGCD